MFISSFINHFWSFFIIALGDLENSIDGVGENDDRLTVTDLLDDLKEQLEDQSESLLDTSDSVGSFGTTTEDNKDNVANGITLLMFLPAIVHLLTMICMGACCKKGGRFPLFANMCFNYVMIIIYCSIAGIILIFSLINEDVCDSHIAFLQVWLWPFLLLQVYFFFNILS